MRTYFGTFISGFSEVVNEQLIKFDNDLKVVKLLDGLVIFETNKNIDAVRNLRFFSNSFILLDANSDFNLEDTGITINKRNNTFRVVFSKFNKLISVDESIQKDIESRIALTTSLVVNRSKPDLEFWFIERSEGINLFGLRITRHGDYKKRLQKGELRPELSNLLCVLSDPNQKDVFLDPFSGSGSISDERKKITSYKSILFGDIKSKDKNKLDALNLEFISNNSINKIVTDPPWGVTIGKDLDLNEFYKKMLIEFYRVLDQNGILVLLIGNKELFGSVLNNYYDKFMLKNKYDILVNGKKARVYKLVKL